MAKREMVIRRKIARIIKLNDFIDNIYVRKHLEYVIKRQKELKKLFKLSYGIWEVSERGSIIDLWRLDKKGVVIHIETAGV